MEKYKLGEMETAFAEIIWNTAPVTSGELVKICEKELEWKKSTTYTMLKKLCEKGFAENEKSTVRSLIPREMVQKAESERIVEQTFSGSLPGFLVAFLGGKTISEREAEELKRLIDSHREV